MYARTLPGPEKTTLITWIFGWAWYPPWHLSGPPGSLLWQKVSYLRLCQICPLFLNCIDNKSINQNSHPTIYAFVDRNSPRNDMNAYSLFYVWQSVCHNVFLHTQLPDPWLRKELPKLTWDWDMFGYEMIVPIQVRSGPEWWLTRQVQASTL